MPRDLLGVLGKSLPCCQLQVTGNDCTAFSPYSSLSSQIPSAALHADFLFPVLACRLFVLLHHSLDVCILSSSF